MTQETPDPFLTEEEVMFSARRIQETSPSDDFGRAEFRYLVFEDLVSTRGLPMVNHEVGGRIPDFEDQAVQALNTDLVRFEGLLRSQS